MAKTMEEKQRIINEMTQKILSASDMREVKEVNEQDDMANSLAIRSNKILSTSINNFSVRGENSNEIVQSLTKLADIAKDGADAFTEKKKLFGLIPTPFKKGIKEALVKFKTAKDMIEEVSYTLNEFSDKLKRDSCSLSENINQIKVFKEDIGDTIEISNGVIENIEKVYGELPIDSEERGSFVQKINTANRKLAGLRKKEGILNSAILQLQAQKKSGLDILESVEEQKAIVPLTMSVCSLVAMTQDTQMKIQNSLEMISEQTDKMYIQTLENQSQLLKQTENFKVKDGKELIGAINNLIGELDRNKEKAKQLNSGFKQNIKEWEEASKLLNQKIKENEEN